MTALNFNTSQKETKGVIDKEGKVAPPHLQDVESFLDIQGTPSVDPLDENDASQDGFQDPNAVKVTISDEKTPLVILFGPPSCGKTMTLVRLTRYLIGKGYTVRPIRSFRPTEDKNYEKMCNDFDKMINSDDAAKSTANINFMLIQVLWKGKVVCQILEGPGELYFSPTNPTAEYPAYLNTIIHSSNRKIWVVMLEPDSTNVRMDTVARRHYVNRIHRLKKSIDSCDKIIFLYNKIDNTDFVSAPGNVRITSVREEANNLYPHIFEPFRNEIPVAKLISPYNFDLVAFQTGSFTSTSDGTITYQEGKRVYPEKLWRIMLKRIRGGWL